MKKGFDTRALLAVLALVGAIGYQFYMFFLLRTPALEIPAWLSAVVMGVTGFYFGSKGSSEAGVMHEAAKTGATVTVTPVVPANGTPSEG